MVNFPSCCTKTDDKIIPSKPRFNTNLGSYPVCTSTSYLCPSSNTRTPAISLGPIIGKTTDTTTRIVIEIDHECLTPITCSLRPQKRTSNAPVVSHSELARVDRPTVFVFANLVPDTLYTVLFSIPVQCCLNSSVRTLPRKSTRLEHHPFPIGVISSERSPQFDPFTMELPEGYKETQRMWEGLYAKACSGKLKYLVHLGEHVDMLLSKTTRLPDIGFNLSGISDAKTSEATAFQLGCMIFENADSTINGHERVCELFRQVYRNAWTAPYVRQTMANVPNIMLLRENEIGKFTSIETADENQLVGSDIELAVANCAYEVFQEYARSLDRRYEPEKSLKRAYHIHSLGAVGIVALDTRAELTLDNDEQELVPFGKRQWDAFKRAIEGRMFEETTLLVVCVQDPLDKGDFWELSDTINDGRKDLVKILNRWRDAKPLCSREVIIITPDTRSRITDIIDESFESKLHKKLDLSDDICGSGVEYKCPVKFLPRNRLRQISVGPLSGSGALDLGTLRKDSRGPYSSTDGKNLLSFIRYPPLNGNSFCVVTGDSKYIKKDSHLFSESRLARKARNEVMICSCSEDHDYGLSLHTDLTRFWSQFYFLAGGDFIAKENPVESSRFRPKPTTTKLCSAII